MMKNNKMSIIFVLSILAILFVTGCAQSNNHTMDNGEANTKLRFDSAPEAGKTAHFQIVLKDKQGNPLNLQIEHDRFVHAVIVSEDLQSIAHIHPEDFAGGTISTEMKESGMYPLQFTFPKAGKYVLAMNILTQDGESARDFIFEVKGSPQMDKVLFDPKKQQIVQGVPEEGGKNRFVKAVDIKQVETTLDGYLVTLTTPQQIKAGQKVVLTEHFKKDGKPFDQLSTFLGAPMHFAVIKEGLDVALHTHGTLPNTNGGHGSHMAAQTIGPDINLEVTFPKAGIYRIFGQAKHENKIIFTGFMVEVTS